jgi:hypothetical protein
LSYVPSTARQAGQPSVATVRRIPLTRGLARSRARATAVEECSERSAPQLEQAAAVSGDWVWHTVQVRIGKSQREGG